VGPDAADPTDLRRVLDALPGVLLEMPRRPSWSDGAAHYASVLGAALPAEAARARGLAEAVAGGLDLVDEPTVPVHGDFYEGQLLVAGRQVTGVLDVDSAGPGHRADDVGCLLAHVAVLTQVWPGDAPALAGAVEAWSRVLAADPLTSPEALRLRTAGVLLSLATGPHRVQQDGWEAATTARLDLVERWLSGPLGGPVLA
jgi:aminoglycoside phosphotransferase (APT) family kinase protein